MCKRQVVQQARANEALIQDMQSFLKGVEETPGAVGLRGAIGQPAAGYAEQILGGAAGNAIGKAITGASPKDVANIRVKSQMIRSRLLPIVTNETGRYTEAERQIATDVSGALDIAQGPEQVKAAARALIGLSYADRQRNGKFLGEKRKYDTKTQEGFLQQARELKALGLDDKEAVEMTKVIDSIWAE